MPNDCTHNETRYNVFKAAISSKTLFFSCYHINYTQSVFISSARAITHRYIIMNDKFYMEYAILFGVGLITFS
jgi:hypothetical protein